MSHQKSILLTTPDGLQSNLHDMKETLNRQQSDNSVPTNIQFDHEQIENDRGRSKKRDANKRSDNISASRNSISRSRSRASSRIREEEFLRWTVLRRDPSMRLKIRKNQGKKNGNSESGNTIGPSDSDSDDDDDSGYFDEKDCEDFYEISDEEQVSDVENELDIDEEFNFDLGLKVLPNYCLSINEVLESSKPWIAEYEKTNEFKDDSVINVETLEGGYIKATELITKGEGFKPNKSTYILYADLTSESVYALTYILGSLINDGDALYIVHWESNSRTGNKDKMKENVKKIERHVRHLNDCNNIIIKNLDVIILSITHPYPKHLLNEMIYGLKPKSLCCSLSLVLSPSGLQNYVCSIPMLVIRKKLKRTRRKGINE